MDMSYDTFRDLDEAFRYYHRMPGDWDALNKLNQALKDSGIQNDATRAASKVIDAIVLQSIIEEAEWKELEAAGLTISLFVELNLAEMRHHKDKKAPFMDLYEEIQWLRDDLNTIKNNPNEDHPALWKQATYTVEKLEKDNRVPTDDPILKIALNNLRFIEKERQAGANEQQFAPYVTLLFQSHEILGRYLVDLQRQAFEGKSDAA